MKALRHFAISWILVQIGTFTMGTPAFALEPTTRQIQDVDYNFDAEKLSVAKDSFHFLRSFVDYFYLLVNQNKTQLKTIENLMDTSGWCVGDAHAENFGTQISANGDPIFTMNDMDDSGPCPIILDLFRLMVSSQLYDKSVSLNKIVSNYVDGLKGHKHTFSDPVLKMLDKAKKRGTSIDPEKLQDGKLVRGPGTRELNDEEKEQLSQVIIHFGQILDKDARIVDTLATAKIGGGSGGLLRYEVLLSNAGTLLHLELKEEVKPAIYPVATEPVPPVQQRIFNTLYINQLGTESPFYGVTVVNNKNMLIRPKFAGEIGVNLAKNSISENEDIIDDEAYILGVIHSRRPHNQGHFEDQVDKIDSGKWKDDVNLLVDFYNRKFKTL